MADEGASPRELILEACRRNNTDLLTEVFTALQKTHGKQKAPSEIASLLNSVKDGVGNGALHVAAINGNYEVIDMILDQEGVEIDDVDRMEKDTPLHKAVRYVNGLRHEEWGVGQELVDMMLDAGCDPRIRNKAKLRPIDLADPRNDALRNALRKAEYSITVGDDVVQDDSDDQGAGSGSD